MASNSLSTAHATQTQYKEPKFIMNTTTSWLGRASVALAATALATGILLAGMAHEGKECKRLTNVCASNAAGKALCRSERCPGRMPMLQGNRLERERRRLSHHRWRARRVLQHMEWPMLPPAHVVQRTFTSAMRQPFQPSYPT